MNLEVVILPVSDVDRAPGVHPDRADYATFADFPDPDGNVWTLQERGFTDRRLS